MSLTHHGRRRPMGGLCSRQSFHSSRVSKSGFDVKVVRLAELLAIAPAVFQSPRFAMKGGTALNLFVQDMGVRRVAGSAEASENGSLDRQCHT
ncbi:MAG: hypothetical protein WD944_02550 [Steroidobacteraceae bacterium]